MSKKKSVPAAPSLHWHLRALMTRQRIRSVAQLHRRLSLYGALISEVQLGRLVNSLPLRLNTAVLGALCRALECEPGELLSWQATSAPKTAAAAKAPTTPRRSPSAEEIRRAIGPAFEVVTSSPGRVHER